MALPYFTLSSRSNISVTIATFPEPREWDYGKWIGGKKKNRWIRSKRWRNIFFFFFHHSQRVTGVRSSTASRFFLVQFERIETNSITGNAILSLLTCNREKHIQHLYSFAFIGDTRGNECPEDSVQGEGGECKCAAAIDCPSVECESGQRRIQVKPADPETPGSCCARYDCLPSGKRSN